MSRLGLRAKRSLMCMLPDEVLNIPLMQFLIPLGRAKSASALHPESQFPSRSK
jgi:hypothetical protein